VLLAIGARRQQDNDVRRALTVLSSLYVVLFALDTALGLVVWGLIGDPAGLSVDLALELAYNVLTVVWVTRYADAFAEATPSEAESAQGFDALCESFKISAREREIIELICQGLTNREIASRLFCSSRSEPSRTTTTRSSRRPACGTVRNWRGSSRNRPLIATSRGLRPGRRRASVASSDPTSPMPRRAVTCAARRAWACCGKHHHCGARGHPAACPDGPSTVTFLLP
jgi:hypothetical protein